MGRAADYGKIDIDVLGMIQGIYDQPKIIKSC